MKLRHTLGATLLLLALSLTCVPVKAGTIVENTAGTFASAAGYFGQSFTTPTGGPWYDIGFAFLTPGDAPYALGSLFLTTTPYTGTPAGLSSSMAGFVAESTTISGGMWVFSSSVALQSSTTYYVYSTGNFPLHAIEGGSPISGGAGNYYYTSSSTTDFTSPGGFSANFEVSDAPEPGTASVTLLGILALAGIVARRRLATRSLTRA